MVGIMQQQTAQAGAPAAGQPGGQTDVNALEPEEPTPEEQEAFSRIELAADKVINSQPESYKNMMSIIKAEEENPAVGLAKAALVIFQVVDEKAPQGIPEELLLRGAEVTLDLVIREVEETGVMEVDESLANRAMKEMVVLAGQAYEFDTSELEAAMESRADLNMGTKEAGV